MSDDSEQLVSFIRVAKEHAVGDDFVVTLLKQNGWSERRIFGAFSSYYTEVLGMPLPSRSGRVENARDAFLYLLAFIALGFWTVALGSLFYVLIDRWFPDSASIGLYSSYSRDELATQLATMIVAFPLFLIVSRFIAGEVRRRPDLLDSGVRKWLTYIALVVAAIVLLGDGIWFLDAFLRGELSARFLLKSLVLLAIAGGIFTYYLATMRSDAVDSTQRDRIFAALAVASVILGAALGFFDFGSPAQARLRALDQRRVEDLTAITGAIHQRWSLKKAGFVLPPVLDDSLAGYGRSTTDPGTGVRYSYTPRGVTAYALCATFGLASDSDAPAKWRHTAGWQCFALDAQTDTGY
jgi:hypothetical protein